MVDFNKTFKPTVDEEIEALQCLLKINELQKSKCTTCVHMIGSDEPGVVTDFGGCKLDLPEFAQKTIYGKNILCQYYKEDTDFANKVRKRIEELKREVEMNNGKID